MEKSDNKKSCLKLMQASFHSLTKQLSEVANTEELSARIKVESSEQLVINEQIVVVTAEEDGSSHECDHQHLSRISPESIPAAPYDMVTKDKKLVSVSDEYPVSPRSPAMESHMGPPQSISRMHLESPIGFASQLQESPVGSPLGFHSLRTTESLHPLHSNSESPSFMITADYEKHPSSLAMPRTCLYVVSPMEDSLTPQHPAVTSTMTSIVESSIKNLESNCELLETDLKSSNRKTLLVAETDNDKSPQIDKIPNISFSNSCSFPPNGDTLTDVPIESGKCLTIVPPKESVHVDTLSTIILDQRFLDQLGAGFSYQISFVQGLPVLSTISHGATTEHVEADSVEDDNVAWRHTSAVSGNGITSVPQTALVSSSRSLLPKYECAPASPQAVEPEIASGQPYLQVALASDMDASSVAVVAADQVLVMADMCSCQWRSCEMSFASSAALVEHVNSEHITAENKLQFVCGWRDCVREGRPFDARYKIVIHMRTHTGERPHLCPVKDCGASFSRIENLKIHCRSHTGEKPYVCPVEGCNRSFANSSDRFKHKRTHQERTPYRCQVAGCSKSYTDPSSLRKHKKRHEAGFIKAFKRTVYMRKEKPPDRTNVA